jgi:hypothetical protein
MSDRVDKLIADLMEIGITRSNGLAYYRHGEPTRAEILDVIDRYFLPECDRCGITNGHLPYCPNGDHAQRHAGSVDWSLEYLTLLERVQKLTEALSGWRRIDPEPERKPTHIYRETNMVTIVRDDMSNEGHYNHYLIEFRDGERRIVDVKDVRLIVAKPEPRFNIGDRVKVDKLIDHFTSGMLGVVVSWANVSEYADRTFNYGIQLDNETENPRFYDEKYLRRHDPKDEAWEWVAWKLEWPEEEQENRRDEFYQLLDAVIEEAKR